MTFERILLCQFINLLRENFEDKSNSEGQENPDPIYEIINTQCLTYFCKTQIKFNDLP